MLAKNNSTVHALKARELVPLAGTTRLFASVSAVLCMAIAGGCDNSSPPTETAASEAARKPDASQNTPPMPTVTEPASREPTPPVATTPGPTTPAQASAETPWTAPESWTFDPTPRSMRLATYRAPAGQAEAEIAISRFGGDVGGELANINRWRTQVGLPAIDEASLQTEVTRFGDDAAPGYVVRAAGERVHLLAAGVYDPATDQTWFVRVMGAPEMIDAIEADVQEFARSISRAIAGG